jgi:Dyp-type peroxidase family
MAISRKHWIVGLIAGAVVGLGAVWARRKYDDIDSQPFLDPDPILPALERLEIQGNVLAAYNMPFTRYTFLRVNDAELGRRFVAGVAGQITSAEFWSEGQKPSSTFNVAFSFNGLKALGLPAKTLASFPQDFAQGMAARAGAIGDSGVSAPDHWDSQWTGGDIHIWTCIYGMTAADRQSRSDWLQTQVRASGGGVTIVASQDAASLVADDAPTALEHFGYSDGFGNPDIAGSGFPSIPGRGKLVPGGGWAPIAAGEFLLGYVDEAAELPAAPLPAEFSRNGTFLVYRKLHQNVGAFRRYLREQGALFEGGPELLAAKLLGRWRDGTPVVRSPRAGDAALCASASGLADFTYADDADGARCPLGAHIRRVNPRDAIGLGGVVVNRHRLVRRGVPYGSWLPDDGRDVDDTGERGLIFIALAASIDRQFEFVCREWINYGNDFRQGNDKDPIVGQHTGTGKHVVQGQPGRFRPDPPFICFDLPRFVETRGGEYFFLPSLSAIEMIGSGAIDPS